MPATDTLLQSLALAMMNLSPSEVEQFGAIGRQPGLGAAAEFSWWLRILADRELQRRAGATVEFPHPDFDFWTRTDCADSLVAALTVVDGTRERLGDVAIEILKIVGLVAAVRLKEVDVVRSN